MGICHRNAREIAPSWPPETPERAGPICSRILASAKEDHRLTLSPRWPYGWHTVDTSL